MADGKIAAYDMTDPDNPRKLLISANQDQDHAGEANPFWTINNQTYRAYTYIHNIDYAENLADLPAPLNDTGTDGFSSEQSMGGGMYAFIPSTQSGLSEADMAGTSTIVAYPAYSAESSVAFSTSTVDNEFTLSHKKERFANVGLVPNPYLGAHAGETTRNTAFQRIRNVGPNTTVNIFTVDGQHVRTLRKTDNNTTWLDWNLENKGRLTVAAGLYIMHIKEEGVGEKVLKSFVIPRSKKVTKR